MSSIKLNRVFVYGTLKNGFNNHGLLRGAIFCGEAISPKAFYLKSVSSQGGYPIIVDGSFAVKGEVYDVDDLTLSQLDRLEGTPMLYQRRVMHVEGMGDVSYYFWNPNNRNRGYDGTPYVSIDDNDVMTWSDR